MDWILIGVVAGSLITSTFPTKEACLGRQATLWEQKIYAKCIDSPLHGSGLSSGINCYNVGTDGVAHCQ